MYLRVDRLMSLQPNPIITHWIKSKSWRVNHIVRQNKQQSNFFIQVILYFKVYLMTCPASPIILLPALVL